MTAVLARQEPPQAGLLAEIETDLENTLHAHEQRPVPADSAAGNPAAGAIGPLGEVTGAAAG